MDSTFPGWLNANSGRAYPLAEDSTRADISGNFVIPDSLLVAAQVNMIQHYATGVFFISSVMSVPSSIQIFVGFKPETGDAREVACVRIPVLTHEENTTYSFVGGGQDTSVFGSITIGRLTDTLERISGLVSFLPESTPFEVSALMVSSPAVEAVELYEGGALFGRFTKVLKLRAGENLRFSRVDGDQNTVRIDAIQGENLVSPDQCENAVPLPPPIRTINNAPSIDGNFDIDGGKCISVESGAGILSLKDLCSQSCCGCEELAELMSGLRQVEAQRDSLRQQIALVSSQQALMLANLSAQQQ